MEVETAAAATRQRQRQEEAEEAGAKAAAARGTDVPATEQAGFTKNAGGEAPDLEPVAAVAGGFRASDAMPRRGLTRKANGTLTRKSQHNHRWDEGFASTDPGSHLMQSVGTYLQDDNCQLGVGSDHQVIVAAGVSKQPPDDEHLGPRLPCIAASTGAWPAASAETWTVSQGSRRQDPQGPRARKPKGFSELRPAEGDRGAGERPDQGGPGPAALSVAGP